MNSAEGGAIERWAKGGLWSVIKATGTNFIADEALSHGASIAYYTLFSVAPVLLIVIAIASLIFGRDAAESAIVTQLSGLMGESTAKALEEIIRKVGDREAGTWGTLIGIGTLILTASGVFGEIQSALNLIWKAKEYKSKQRASTITRLAKARAASLGLVMTCGFLITVSLAVSAGLEGLAGYLRSAFPGFEIVLAVIDFIISTALIAFMFAAVYKVLPDRPVAWRDVVVGAAVTALLFEGGKYLIGLYIGKSNVAATYGAAGAVIVLLLWIYYTAQIFLIGAEFTHAYSERYGSKALEKAPPQEMLPASSAQRQRRSLRSGIILRVLEALLFSPRAVRATRETRDRRRTRGSIADSRNDLRGWRGTDRTIG